VLSLRSDSELRDLLLSVCLAGPPLSEPLFLAPYFSLLIRPVFEERTVASGLSSLAPRAPLLSFLMSDFRRLLLEIKKQEGVPFSLPFELSSRL